MLASGQTLLLGIALGYIFFSIFESIAHRYLLHAKRHTRIYWKNLGCLGEYITNSWYSHYVIHHCRTFRTSHVTIFDSKQQEKELEQFLIENDKVLIPV